MGIPVAATERFVLRRRICGWIGRRVRILRSAVSGSRVERPGDMRTLGEDMGPRIGIDKKKILREFPLFSGIAADHLADLERGAQTLTFQRGQTIYVAGGPARQIYIALSGQVKLVLVSQRGNEKVVDVVDAGRSFGEP